MADASFVQSDDLAPLEQSVIAHIVAAAAQTRRPAAELYVLAFTAQDARASKHELLHALYFFDAQYRAIVSG